MSASESKSLFQRGVSMLAYLGQLLRRFWYCWVILWISHEVQENYPFSHNPMYGRWDPHTFVLYTTDENDKVLYFYNEFGQTAVKLKKIVKTLEKEIEKEQPELNEDQRYKLAGERALKHYHDTRLPKTESPSSYQKLKLWRSDLVLVEEGIQKDDWVMSTFTPEAG